jgi:hypothetical protein
MDGSLKSFVRKMLMRVDVSGLSRRKMPAYRVGPVPLNATVMSPVISPPGTTVLSAQVRPPSFDMKYGADSPPSGSGVKAVATI